MGLEGGGDRSLHWAKTHGRPCRSQSSVPLHRYPFIWKKDATHGILEMLTHGLPQTPPLTRVVQDRGHKSDNTRGACGDFATRIGILGSLLLSRLRFDV